MNPRETSSRMDIAIEIIRRKLGSNALLFLPSNVWVYACMQRHGFAGVIDVSTGKYLVIAPLGDNELVESENIVRYSTVPTEGTYIVGDLRDAVIAAIKSFKRNILAIPMHEIPGELLEILLRLGMKIENCYEELKRLLTPINDRELELVSAAGEQAWNALISTRYGEARLNIDRRERVIIAQGSGITEVVYCIGSFCGYACASSSHTLKNDKIFKAMRLGIEALRKNLSLLYLVNTLRKTLEFSGITLINAEFHLWGLTRTLTEAPVLDLTQRLDTPCSIAFKLIMRIEKRYEVLGGTITISTRGDVKVNTLTGGVEN